MKIDEAARKKNLLVARQKRAEVQKHIHEVMTGLSDTSAFEAFDRMAARVDQVEAGCGLELSQELSGETMEERFRVLEGSVDVDQELQAEGKGPEGLVPLRDDDARHRYEADLTAAVKPDEAGPDQCSSEARPPPPTECLRHGDLRSRSNIGSHLRYDGRRVASVPVEPRFSCSLTWAGIISSIVYGLLGLILLLISYSVYELITPWSVKEELTTAIPRWPWLSRRLSSAWPSSSRPLFAIAASRSSWRQLSDRSRRPSWSMFAVGQEMAYRVPWW